MFTRQATDFILNIFHWCCAIFIKVGGFVKSNRKASTKNRKRKRSSCGRRAAAAGPSHFLYIRPFAQTLSLSFSFLSLFYISFNLSILSLVYSLSLSLSLFFFSLSLTFILYPTARTHSPPIFSRLSLSFTNHILYLTLGHIALFSFWLSLFSQSRSLMTTKSSITHSLSTQFLIYTASPS